MREIKFRSWDNENKIMFYDDEFVITLDGRILKEKVDKYSVNCKDQIIMQYTGLKDKNGKEIYEGDILKYWEEYSIIKTEMDFNCGCCNDVYGWDIPNVMDIEVIGNIYENPELLNEQNNKL